MSSFNATHEQVDAVSASVNHQITKMIAYAGAGKTSTVVMIANELEKLNQKGLYLAFNKTIATEAQSKLPLSCNARTFHSLALSNTPAKIRKKSGSLSLNRYQQTLCF